jgi:hypothetical protein
MASLVLSGNTSGSVTISSPAVSGSNTLTLPASTGTVILSDASANIQFNSGYGSVATAYGCRAWVNFNGRGTVAIRASGNVTSITDNGAGDYTVNFTTAMPDGNYSVGFAHQFDSAGQLDSGISPQIFSTTAYSPSTSSLRILMVYLAGAYDCSIVSVQIFR